MVGQIFPHAAAHTLTSSEARYTHRCATSSAVHILPVFCLAIKSLKAWVEEGQEHCRLLDLQLTLTYSRIRTCSGSAWAWILSLSDGVSTVPGKRTLIYRHISFAGWWATGCQKSRDKICFRATSSVFRILFLIMQMQTTAPKKIFNVQEALITQGLPDAAEGEILDITERGGKTF